MIQTFVADSSRTESVDLCMFCGQGIKDQGEGYYDHIRKSPGCTSAWREWSDRLVADHPGGD